MSDKYPYNVPLANYFDPAHHSDDEPISHPTPWEFYCLDDAQENIAHIEVWVREWNEEVEFDADRNPDTLGTEANWNLPRTDDINDVPDWKDLDPGSDTYPSVVPAK